jgi:putative ABC transport system permease protein
VARPRGDSIGLGAGGALSFTRTMRGLLTNVAPNDPLVFAATGAGLVVVALVACYLAARQAARTESSVVLRSE